MGASTVAATRRPRRQREFLTAVALIVLALVITDLLIGAYQRHILDTRRANQERIERLTFRSLRVDVDSVTYTSDGRYHVRLWLANSDPKHDLYVMMPTVSAFVQAGPQWKEMRITESTADPKLKEGSVVHLQKKVTVDWIVDIPAANYSQLFPGFMHTQFADELLVSLEPEPKEYVVERHDNIYGYVKPIGTRDDEIRRHNQFPGDVPIWWPMRGPYTAD